MKVYNIDDDQISNFLNERILEEAGLASDIRSFLSAEDVLAYMQQDCEENLPDIIFLDLNMPMMNGWEFLDILMQHKNVLKDKCHIYILTSSLDISDTARSKEYDLVSGFIHKPLKLEDVQLILSEIEDQAG
ncbi:response regulator [Pontibacter sp. H249]|uniref:response regulator n=1 Tax=Pontibacter sp. H249 TaxID=3133420 RepID=UPI0030BD0C08